MTADKKPSKPTVPPPRGDKSKVLQAGGPAAPSDEKQEPPKDDLPQTFEIISDGSDG